MKPVLLMLTLLAGLGPLQTAQADHSHWGVGISRGYDWASWRSFNRFDRFDRFDRVNHFGPWRANHWQVNPWRDPWYARDWDRRAFRPYRGSTVFLGGYGGGFTTGLVVGSVLAAPSIQTIPSRRTETVVIQRSSPPVNAQRFTRRLLRDLQGRCFERINDGGREVRIEVDAAACGG